MKTTAWRPRLRAVPAGSYSRLHFLQMGVYFRFAGVVEVSIRSLCAGKMDNFPQGIAVYLSHDLSMLRLIEAFSESAPQIVLMLSIIIHNSKPELITLLKTAASVSAIAVSVTMYHRSLRSFLPSKAKQGWCSSLVYFLWNMLLIAPRVAALALFASVLPCYVAAHFLSLWMVLFFCAWRSNTDFMDSVGGEWLFRATVGLIWYFSWFNVVKGRTRGRTVLYYSVITIDISLLCGLWYWKITTEPPYFDPPLPPHVVFISIAVLFSTGLILRLIYYKFFHPKHTADEPKPEQESQGEDEVDFRMMSHMEEGSRGLDQVDFRMMSGSGFVGSPEPCAPVTRVNKRMKNLAANFYT